MDSCCSFAQKSSARFFCKTCQKFICCHHATIWTNQIIRCPYCFSEIGQFSQSTFPIEIISGLKKPKLAGIPIGIIIDGMYVAGAQRHILSLLDVLNKAGFNCYIISLYGGGRWYDIFRSKCVSMLMAYGNPKKDDPIIVKFLENLNIKLFNTHLLISAERAYKMGLKNYIMTVHSFLTTHEFPSKGVTDKALCTASTIITPSHRIGNDIVSWIGNNHPKIEIIPNCVDTQKFHPRRSPERSKQYEFQIGYVGRLDSDKLNVELLIGTLKRLQNANLDIHLEIAGDGELKNKLLEGFYRENLHDKVTFLGFMDDVSKVYANVDLIFFPSLNEGLSIAALEAMAMGRVVVATDVGDMKILSSHNSALIIPPGDIDAASEAILSIAKDKILKDHIEKQARIFALNYSEDKWSKKLLPVFQNTLNKLEGRY